MSSPAGQAAMGRLIEDEANFVDLADSTLFLVEETEITLSVGDRARRA